MKRIRWDVKLRMEGHARKGNSILHRVMCNKWGLSFDAGQQEVFAEECLLSFRLGWNFVVKI